MSAGDALQSPSDAGAASAPLPLTGESPQEESTALLLLASASAGRRSVLERAGIDFDLAVADLDEEAILEAARAARAQAGEALAPEEAVLLLAREKATAVAEASEGGYVVLGCDSMLEIDGEIIGKPGTLQRAADRWRAVRGRTAVLHSGHWLIDDRDVEDEGTGATLGATASTEVTFADLSDEEIQAYVSSGEPLGVAGGFTIDGLGGPFIERIDGDPHAVIGLSLPLLRHLLAEVGIGVHELWRHA